MTTTNSSLEVNPKEALPSGAPVDRVVLRYSQPSHRAFFASVMQRLQQPEVSPRQLLSALSHAVDEMEADEARKAEEEARRIEEEKKRAEEEARRIEEEKRKAEEEVRRIEEQKKRVEEEKKRAEEEAKRAEEEKKRRAEEQWKRAEEEARRVEEEKKKRAEEEAMKALEEARKAAQEAAKRAEEEKKSELSARACGVCKASNPSARAVFATCGHVACLGCAEGAAARGTRLECPFCSAPTTYMRLFERELITQKAESSPKSPRGVRFSDTNEVKEFDKEDEEQGSEAADPTNGTVAVKGGSSLGCGFPWFGKKAE